MPKRQEATKRLRPASLNAWLKKENPETENDTKKLRQTVRVCLEPLDTKILDKPKNSTKSNKKLQKPTLSGKENKETDQPKGLRRSARHLSSDQKPVYAEEEPESEEPEAKEVAKEYIKTLSPILFEGKIKFVNEFGECASVCDSLLSEVESSKNSMVPIGFDLEWPFSFRTGSGKTALAQICLSEKECYLLHLYEFKKLPASLIALLSHPKVKLVGVNIKNDVRKLARDFKEFPDQKVVDENCLDCGPYANSVYHRSGRWSLERLTAFLLKKKISKDPEVRMSKWHIQPLNDKQKLYAATDAYVSLLLHLTIEKQEVLNQLKEEAEAEAATTASIATSVN